MHSYHFLCLPWVGFNSDVNKSAHLAQQEAHLDMYAVIATVQNQTWICAQSKLRSS